MSRFVDEGLEYIRFPGSICPDCKHIRYGRQTCDAFPDGIPGDFLGGRKEHREPVDGDGGIVFEPREK